MRDVVKSQAEPADGLWRDAHAYRDRIVLGFSQDIRLEQRPQIPFAAMMQPAGNRQIVIFAPELRPRVVIASLVASAEIASDLPRRPVVVERGSCSVSDIAARESIAPIRRREGVLRAVGISRTLHRSHQ